MDFKQLNSICTIVLGENAGIRNKFICQNNALKHNLKNRILEKPLNKNNNKEYDFYKNELFQSSFVTESLKFEFTQENTGHKFENKLKYIIPKGNFYFPLETNYRVERKENEFKSNNFPVNEDNDNLRDDALTNSFIIEFLKICNNDNVISKDYSMAFEYISVFFKIKNKNDIYKRFKLLYYRFKSFHEKNEFIYLSAKENEELTFNSIINTYKDFFCIICLKFNCNIHGLKYESISDNPSENDFNQYIKSFKKISLISNYSIGNDNLNGDSFINETKQLLNGCNKRLTNLLNSNSLNIELDPNEEFNLFQGRKEDYIKNSNCSRFCFINILNNRKINHTNNTTDNLLSKVEMIYLKKLFRIYKFDPCSIFAVLKSIIKVEPIKKAKLKLPKERIWVNEPIDNLIKGKISNSNKTEKQINISVKIDRISCINIFLELLKLNYDEIFKNFVKIPLKSHKSKTVKKRKSCSRNQIISIIRKQTKNNQFKSYVPCYHKDNESCSKKNCECSDRGICEKYCSCDPNVCLLRYNGCKCESGNCSFQNCPCYSSGRECDVDLCKNCNYFDTENELMKLNCKNKLLQMNFEKNLAIGTSDVAGLGVFALEKFNKGDFIAEYVGEIISHEDAERREIMNEQDNSTYMFNLNHEFIIDARLMGNKIRFANHSKRYQNANTKIVFVSGQHRVIIYAKQDIPVMQEIFFDYDGLNILADKFSWVDDKNSSKYLNFKRKKSVNLSCGELVFGDENDKKRK